MTGFQSGSKLTSNTEQYLSLQSVNTRRYLKIWGL